MALDTVCVTTVCGINHSCTMCYIYPGAHSLVKLSWQSRLFDQKEIETHYGKFCLSKYSLEINGALRHISHEGLCHKQNRSFQNKQLCKKHFDVVQQNKKLNLWFKSAKVEHFVMHFQGSQFSYQNLQY